IVADTLHDHDVEQRRVLAVALQVGGVQIGVDSPDRYSDLLQGRDGIVREGRPEDRDRYLRRRGGGLGENAILDGGWSARREEVLSHELGCLALVVGPHLLQRRLDLSGGHPLFYVE